MKSGAGDGSRTRYLNLGKVALYQMSYSRTPRQDFPAATNVPNIERPLMERVMGIEPT